MKHEARKPMQNDRKFSRTDNDELRILSPAEFPLQLREIPHPPPQLWLRGTLPPPECRLLAVVGSRAMTSYGREVCSFLIEGLHGYPISIVSGLALGTDAHAHKAALRAELHTIAIPGSGLEYEVLYPRTNVRLAKNIIDAGGALLSEQSPNHRARSFDFPLRNRIMAGISHATLIIEAGEKSGTLITARLASDYNRELLCVPHRIGDPHGFAASIFLPRGAMYVTEPRDIIETLGLTFRDETMALPLPTLTKNEQLVYELLEEPTMQDEVIRRSHIPAGECLTALISLQLKKVIVEQFGIWKRT